MPEKIVLTGPFLSKTLKPTMRLIIAFVLLFLVGCGPAPPSSKRELRGSRRSGERDGRREGARERSDRDAKAENDGGGPSDAGSGDFTFPVEVGGSGDIQLTIRMEENNTKAVIQAGGDGHPLNLLAGFNGRFSSEGARQVTLTGGKWELTFHLETDISLTRESGAEVRRGQILGSTTGAVAFYLKENNVPVRFCLNVINLSEGQVKVHKTNVGDECG